jgi:septum site-determining protein MinC
MSQAKSLGDNTSFLLKGSSFTLTTLQLLTLDYESLHAQLGDKVGQAPKFFNHTPVVLDIQKVTTIPIDIDFIKLLNIIRQHGLIPVGLRGGDPEQQSRALALGLAVLPERINKEQEPAQANTLTAVPAPQPVNELSSNTKLITQPVRSGQQIYARGGDLIIMASVGAGSEIIADGHIHVYGTLRGRALAGVNGFDEARIFCTSLEAELVSVAGQYCVNDDLRTSHWGKAVSIALQGDHLQIHPLS